MGCPIHVWLPMMAVAAPFARVARDRVKSAFYRSTPPETPREVKRWAPVGQAASSTDASESAR